MSTKGSRDRTTDKKAYDASPLWHHIDAKKIKAAHEDIKDMPTAEIIAEANRISGNDPNLNAPGAYIRYDKLITEWMVRNTSFDFFDEKNRDLFKPDKKGKN